MKKLGLILVSCILALSLCSCGMDDTAGASSAMGTDNGIVSDVKNGVSDVMSKAENIASDIIS